MLLIENIKKLGISPDRKTLRTFGLLLSGILFGIVFYYFSKYGELNKYLLIPGLLITVIAVILPTWLKYVYIPWMIIARAIGFVITQIILIIFYFLIITPFGLIKRIITYFNKSSKTTKSTYWIKKENTQPDIERMF